MLKRYGPIIFAGAATLAACTNNDAENEKVGSDAVYADYRIWGEEGKESVTVFLQYRSGGAGGNTIVLQKPGSVAIDGIPLNADSAGISGAYYEAAFPVADFSGDHLISFKDPVGKEHKQPFSFSAFSFLHELPATLPMQPLTFQLSGLPDSAKLQLLLTDTAFATNDLNAEIMVINGALNMTDQMWRGLKPGPMVLEIFKEEEKPLYGFSKAGGVLTTHYGLKREFIALPAAIAK